MTFPQVIATGTWAPGTLTTNDYANIPAGVQAGDLVLALWGRAGAIGGGTVAAGWTDLWRQSGANPPLIGCAASYLIADGSTVAGDKLLCTKTSDRGASMSLLIRGFTGTPAFRAPDVQNGTAAPSPGPLSPSWGAGPDTLWIAALFGEYGVGLINSTFPAGYSSGEIVPTTGGSIALAHCRKELAAATEDPGAFSLTAADNSYAAVFAIQGLAASAARFRATII